MSLNLAQEVFTVLFGIFYGTMLARTDWLRPFSPHIAIMQLTHRHLSAVMKRCIVSIILLNIIPLIFFSLALVMLGNAKISMTNELAVSVLQILSVGLLCLAPFGFYRIYVGVAVSKSRYLYDPEDWETIRKEKDVSKWREERNVNSNDIQKLYYFDEPKCHIGSGLLYLILPSLFIVLVFFFFP